jgi:hypothetical protein
VLSPNELECVFGHSPHYSYSFFSERKKNNPRGVKGGIIFFFVRIKIGGGVGGVGGNLRNSLPDKGLFSRHSLNRAF